jgi:hypothetical protein
MAIQAGTPLHKGYCLSYMHGAAEAPASATLTEAKRHWIRQPQRRIWWCTYGIMVITTVTTVEGFWRRTIFSIPTFAHHDGLSLLFVKE